MRTGVFPVHNLQFKIGTAGRSSGVNDFKIIKDIENFTPTIDGQVQEWYAMDQQGWIRRAMTGKALGLAVTGKRNYGDPGNDYVANTILMTGQDVESILQLVFPDGSTFQMDCIVKLNSSFGGAATDIDAFDAEFLSDGLPTFIPAATLLTFSTVDGAVAGNTSIDAVTPVKGGSNSYKVAVNTTVPAVGFNATSWGDAYTLGGDIEAEEDDTVVLVEIVTATGLVVKRGTAHANVA